MAIDAEPVGFCKNSGPAGTRFVRQAGPELAQIKTVKGEPLVFRLKPMKDAPEISLVPFYRLHHERYAVYWKINNPTNTAAVMSNPVP